eukprot:5480213-Karenia_brevis.AAC.1
MALDQAVVKLPCCNPTSAFIQCCRRRSFKTNYTLTAKDPKQQDLRGRWESTRWESTLWESTLWESTLW